MKTSGPMKTWRALEALARNDFKLIRRDSFLYGAVIFIFIIATIFRFAVPLLQRWLAERGYFDLEPLYPLITSYVAVMLGSMMVGVLFGFLLIDERDENTLRALLVTPISLRTYLTYRVGVPVVLTVPLILLVFAILDLTWLPAWQLALIALAGTPLAAFTTLFLPSFADNKVQAFALAKILSAVAFIPIGAYFVDEPWQFLAGAFPPYWVIKAFWTSAADSSAWWLLYLVFGTVSGCLVTAWLVGRFERVAHG